MKRFPFKRHLVILVTCLLAIGVIIPIATFAKSASGEPRNPSHPPQVKMKTNPATGTTDPIVTIMQGCPATAPINSTGFSAGDVVSGTAVFTATDSNEGSEPDEANNTLQVYDTAGKLASHSAPLTVTLNQTKSFGFIATAGDQLNACFAIYDGDEVGTINYTVTHVPTPVPTPSPKPGKIHLPDGSTLQRILCTFSVPNTLVCAFEGLNSRGKQVVLEIIKGGVELGIAAIELTFDHVSLFLVSPDMLEKQCQGGSALACAVLKQLRPSLQA